MHTILSGRAINIPGTTENCLLEIKAKGYAMPEPVSLLLLEFLTWVSCQRRTYAEAMDAWRSSCPRHTVWEDALVEGLIEVQSGGPLQPLEVTLTPRGRALLEENHRPRPSMSETA
jgi:hypothetical protein